MPDLAAILAFYRAVSEVALSGALGSERLAATQGALLRVSADFLTGEERSDLTTLEPAARSARLRKGQHRFRRWEAANPDLVDVLQRKAIAAGGD